MGQGLGGFNGRGCFCLCVQGFDRVHALGLAAFGPTMLVGVGVYIRFFGDGGLGFRPYGGSLFPDAEKVTKKACSCVRPARWGSGFLRCGIDPGAAPTVCFAAPPLAVFGCAKRSLRSHARINPSTQPSDVARGSRSRSKAGELALGLLSGEEHRSRAGELTLGLLSGEEHRSRAGELTLGLLSGEEHRSRAGELALGLLSGEEHRSRAGELALGLLSG